MNLIVADPETAPDASRENLTNDRSQIVNPVELRLMRLARHLRRVERSISAILINESLFIIEGADNSSRVIYSERHSTDFGRRVVDLGEHSVVAQEAVKIQSARHLVGPDDVRVVVNTQHLGYGCARKIDGCVFASAVDESVHKILGVVVRANNHIGITYSVNIGYGRIRKFKRSIIVCNGHGGLRNGCRDEGGE